MNGVGCGATAQLVLFAQVWFFGQHSRLTLPPEEGFPPPALL